MRELGQPLETGKGKKTDQALQSPEEKKDIQQIRENVSQKDMWPQPTFIAVLLIIAKT